MNLITTIRAWRRSSNVIQILILVRARGLIRVIEEARGGAWMLYSFLKIHARMCGLNYSDFVAYQGYVARRCERALKDVASRPDNGGH